MTRISYLDKSRSVPALRLLSCFGLSQIRQICSRLTDRGIRAAWGSKVRHQIAIDITFYHLPPQFAHFFSSSSVQASRRVPYSSEERYVPDVGQKARGSLAIGDTYSRATHDPKKAVWQAVRKGSHFEECSILSELHLFFTNITCNSVNSRTFAYQPFKNAQKLLA